MVARLFAVAVVAALAGLTAGADAERPLSQTPHAGLVTRDYDMGKSMVVSWVLPGPLQPQGQASSLLRRGDLILAVNGRPMGLAEFQQTVARAKPGDVLALTVRHTEGAPDSGTPAPGKGTRESTLNLALAAKADWVGPCEFRKPASWLDDIETEVPLPDGLTPLEAVIEGQVDAQGLRRPVDGLKRYLAGCQRRNAGFHSLRRVAYGFLRPTRLAELQKRVTDPLPDVVRDPRLALVQAAQNLDVAPPALSAGPDFSDPAKALDWAEAAVAQAAALRDQAFAAIPRERQATLAGDLRELLGHLGENKYLMAHPEAGRMLAAMRETMKADYAALLASAAALAGVALPAKAPQAALFRTAPLPAELTGAVRGEILAVRRVEGRWFVYGGFGPNHYDLSRVDVVFDPGGADTYTYSTTSRPAVQVVADLAGDDRYLSLSGGPAMGLLGVSVLADHAGADRYEGRALACGVGALGVGLLVDRGGEDTYTGGPVSQGAAFYGAGMIVDLGKESDVYQGAILCQGVGGPKGFGLLLDENGRDLYRANGPAPSAYGTAAVYCGFSQGVGFGVRMCDTGGIGVLADLAGADRYEAGEFSQGGAYFWGMGILYDRAGNDLYYGNRYAQGFGCHQSIGILADDAGDDTYWSMTAAAQGAAWDEAVGLLIDRAGSDSYQADGLSQGAASMQAMAWLVDLEGTDRYVAQGKATHGQGGGNSYHHWESGCFSWSVLLDAGGTADYYSSGRPNGQTIRFDQINEQKPENSGVYGLFIDLAEKQEAGK